jgi:imidazole glycerol-phosphate synthase subunit HisH
MHDPRGPTAAIVDYELGNLFSVLHACERVGLNATVTSDAAEIRQADALILPGVGAFGDAMRALRERNLIDPILDVADSGKPLVGICLGMQLLMTESHEFGRHQGLGLIPGTVDRFVDPAGPHGTLKVPQVCWNQLHRPPGRGPDAWNDTLLEGLDEGTYFYFVHSYYVQPEDPAVVLSTTRYGDVEFCSCLQYRNLFACQGHPERSGGDGLQVYRNLLQQLAGNRPTLSSSLPAVG